MRGFTLLEVIVALGIVSAGIFAITATLSSYIGTVASLEERVIGSLVAANRLDTLRIVGNDPAVGEVSGTDSMAGRTWYYRQIIKTTPDPALFRVDITVFSDSDLTQQAAAMFSYALKNEAE